MTKDKYKGSYKQIAKAILKYSENPGLDLINFFEQVNFSFLTGNADMHLKNFSLIKGPQTSYVLAPLYNLIASSQIVRGDTEELALNLNGKKRKMVRKDFDTVSFSFKILNEKAIENIYQNFSASIEKWIPFIQQSFLPED